MIDRTFLVANWYRKSKPDVVCVCGGGDKVTSRGGKGEGKEG